MKWQKRTSLSIYYITKSNTKAESVNKGWSLKKKDDQNMKINTQKNIKCKI